MQKLVNYLVILIFLISCHFALGQSLDKYIAEANEHYQSGETGKAAQVMKKAVENFPENSTAYSYLGFYQGTMAGETENFMQAGELIAQSYENLNKAVELDPNNPVARFHRGLMGISVPSFMNKLDEGIADLEFLTELSQKAPEQVPSDLLIFGYDFLAQGYQKKGNQAEAAATWKKIIELAPESDMAHKAKNMISGSASPSPEKEKKPEEKKYTQAELKQLQQKTKQNPNDINLQIKLGKAYIDQAQYEKADDILKNVIQKDSTNVKAYKLLIEAVNGLAGKGYDQTIYEDQSYRTRLVFEIGKLTDKAIALAPDDIALRLNRGITGIMMPFFLGKLDQGIEDLNFVLDSKADQEAKAEATYWLGYAYQKKAITNWIKVITKYPGSDASQYAFQSMRPSVKHFNPADYKKPFVDIDFILGFQDELAPQTVVWIEDKNENFIKTVYVSGFSGYAKEKQVNLPQWSNASDYVDVDGVTGASIDVGHHIYVWDLKDHKGNTVKKGEYVVKIEVAYWPSMEYQMVSVPLTIGSDSKKSVKEEGNLIPYAEVKYYGEDK